MPSGSCVSRKRLVFGRSGRRQGGILPHPPWLPVLGLAMLWLVFLLWNPVALNCQQKQESAKIWEAAHDELREQVDARVMAELWGGRDGGRKKVLGVVGIHTNFHALQRRKALRETWVPSSPRGIARLEEATGLVVKFVIGHTSDAESMVALDQEAQLFNDFIRLSDVDEEAGKHPHKMLAYFKAAYRLFDADFYVKADDNIYVRTDRLSTLLAKDRSSPRTYLGCMKNGPVIQDPAHLWYEPLSYLLGSDYFFHAYGPIYALSSDIVAALASARNSSLRMFSNEDVTIGAWMLAFNVDYEDNRALCDSECRHTSVAVWDIPVCSGLCDAPVKLLQLHNTDICSKSPTLPPAES